MLVSDPEHGLLAPATAFSRERVQGAFERAVTQASDAPRSGLPLARLLYWLHLLVILFWLQDRSADQQATDRLMAWGARVGRLLSPAMRLPPVAAAVRELDEIVRTSTETQPPGA